MPRWFNQVHCLQPHVACLRMPMAASNLDSSFGRTIVAQAAAMKEGTSLANNPAFKE